MKRLHAAFAAPAIPLCAMLVAPISSPVEPARPTAQVIDRDPADLTLLPNSRAAIANRIAGTVALVDLQSGNILSETSVGDEPVSVASSRDGLRLVTVSRRSGELTVLAAGPTLSVVRRIRVGGEPRGVVVDRTGKRAWAALSDHDSVVEVDMETGKTVRTAAVPDEPWHLALTPDGKRLVVGSTNAREITVFDSTNLTVVQRTRTAGRNIRRIAIDPTGTWAYFPMIAERQAPADRVNIDRGWVVGNRLARVRIGADAPREAITLDSLGAGVADVEGCAVAPDGSALAITASGSHEVVLFEKPAALPFVSFGGPGDHVDPDSRRQMARIRVEGAPMACRFSGDGRSVWVVERFGNRLLRIDRTTRRVDRTISLPAPPAVSAVRRGEAVFHDASRSFGSWYSCATCHTEGHTNGGNFDTLNDGGYGKPKKTPSLRGVVETAPFTWHGWQPSLRQAVVESFTKSMQGPAPADSDVDAVMAWLATLEPPRSPRPETAASRRGAALFAAKGCARCHAGPRYTTESTFRVGLEETGDHFRGFNPPSLRNVRQRGPWLHDGRAATLNDVVKTHHSPPKLGIGSAFTEPEVRDIVAFLETL